MTRRALQWTVTVLSLIPVGGGLAGVLAGPNFFDGSTVTVDLDSHHRYLSGLLLGIGLGFWSTVLSIEHKTARFQLLTALVVVGGAGRLLSLIMLGKPSALMMMALAMELAITPALCLWQWKVASAAKAPS